MDQAEDGTAGGRTARRLCCGAMLLAAAAAAFPSALARAGEGAATPRTLMLGLTNETYPSLHGVWASLVYRDAFQRLGYRADVQAFPAKRLTAMVESGELDGELHRAATYGDQHPSLVRVDESHFNTSFSAYAVTDLPLAAGWSGLSHTSYRVEYRAGVYRPETELKKVLEPERLSSVSSSVLGLRKLLAGRTDIFIEHDILMASLLSSDEFRHTGIRRVVLMESVSGHAFLHPRHRELAPRLATVLATMKKEGSIERHRLQAVAALQVRDKPAGSP